ncbi:tetratricopeptide repeat-containing sensor histidine kinase [Spirosoma pollinicola]|uniref:histidine kinase n=1 Tax=Spirosoma pollinicola TaxID=2057025 RepID=A0A2K8ZAQ4_9BACT|nr:tetratricopeptide repeat protein [Spirosoma pollinicola]AUD06967.1 hypothetical protein CWM47_37110 [Spirosoma pollinicola]
MRVIRLVFLLVVCLSLSKAQGQDSLRSALRVQLDSHPQADTFRVNQLNELAYLWRADNDQQTIKLSQEALALSRKLHYRRGEAMALLGLGTGYDSYTTSANVLAYLEQARKLFIQLNDQDGLVRVVSQIGWFYTKRGDYVPALTISLQAQQLAEKTGRLELIARAKARLGGLYTILGDYQQGLEMQSATIQLYERINDQVGICRVLNGLGELHRLEGDYDRASRYYTKAIRLAHVLNNPRLAAQAESNLAAVYVAEGNYEEALEMGYKAINVLATSNQTDVVIWTQAVLARAYLKQNQLDNALDYGRRSLTLSRKGGYREAARDANEILAQVYAAKNKFADAYGYQQQYMAYMDTLTGRNTQRQLALLQYNYGLAEKQAQIALLKKDKALQLETAQRQRQLLLGTFVGMALVSGLLFLAYRNNRQKQKANALLQQQKTEIQAQRDQTNQALVELKTTQNQLIQSEKMASLGELTAGIAHEIQNPLNFVNNFAEVSIELIDELADEQAKAHRDPELEADLLVDLKQNLQKINHHGGRASSIVKGMLQHSRASTGQREATDLNALCDEYLRLAYHGLRAKDKTFNALFTVDLDANLGQVSVVPQDISRVLLNLFTNAFYAVQQRQKQAGSESGYQPTVRVSTRCAGSEVVIKVIDNGTLAS